MAIWVSLQCLGLITLAAVLLQTVAVAVSFMYFNKVLSTMQESFSRSSVSCLINANLRPEIEASAEDKKRDPCWQVTQQLHYHIEKTMADRFQKEISTAMGDKLTGVLPILSPGGVPLPKVAAHVTGVTSFAEPPTADVAGRAAGAQSRPLLHLCPDLLQAALHGGDRRRGKGGDRGNEGGGRSTACPIYLQEDEFLHGAHPADEIVPECLLASGSGARSLLPASGRHRLSAARRPPLHHRQQR